MLDVDARSLRGRICGYTKNDSKITTPYIVRSVYDGECDDNIHIRVTENGRELMFFGSYPRHHQILGQSQYMKAM